VRPKRNTLEKGKELLRLNSGGEKLKDRKGEKTLWGAGSWGSGLKSKISGRLQKNSNKKKQTPRKGEKED